MFGASHTHSSEMYEFGSRWVDRLSCVYTVMGVMVVGILVGVAPYFSPPIRCWTPAHFTQDHTDYVQAVSVNISTRSFHM